MIPKQANKIPFTSLPQFVSTVTSMQRLAWIYRGESAGLNDSRRILRPKAGRDEFYQDSSRLERIGYPKQDLDLYFFERWTHEASAHKRKLPKEDLERLAYAQHYGLATRLLDWTANPLVALFFAVETHENEDAVVYCYSASGRPPLKPEEDHRSVFGVRLYFPRPFDRRISSQQGLFTYHSHPHEEFPVDGKHGEPVEITDGVMREIKDAPPVSDLLAFTIPAVQKYGLQRQLRDLGFTRNTLFPDLDGLSGFINWEMHEGVTMWKWLQTQQPPFDPST